MVTQINNTNFEGFIADGVSFIQVSTSWCGPCKALAPIVESFSEQEEVESVKFGKVDADESREIAQRLGVRSVPSLFVFKNGEIISQSVGMKSKEQLMEMIQHSI
jgi:thioredoxin 1